MKKIREVIRMSCFLGAGIRQIAAAGNIGRTTVSEYVERAGASKPSWPSAGDLSDEELRSLLVPDGKVTRVPARPLRDGSEVRQELSQKGTTLLFPCEEYIKKNRTATVTAALLATTGSGSAPLTCGAADSQGG